MSRTADTEQKIPDLDQELAALADETPEMPADFHEGWMNAIREEAKQTEQPEQAKAEPKGTIRQWRRLAGAAAVMVFLIGGTLLTRGRWTTAPVIAGRVTPVQTAAPEEQSTEAPRATAAPSAPEQTEAKTNMAVMEANQAEESVMAAGSMKADGIAGAGIQAAEKAESRKAAPAAASETAAYTMASEDPESGAVMAQAMDFAALYEAVPEEAAEEADEAAEAPEEEAAERKAEADAAIEDAEPAAEAAMPDHTDAPAETPETEETAQPAESGIGGFFTDMWQFILHVWPYMAGAAVLAGAVMIIRKKQ